MSVYCHTMHKSTVVPQMFYNVISTLHRYITVGPRRCIIQSVTMAEHVCSSFSILMTMVLMLVVQ